MAEQSEVSMQNRQTLKTQTVNATARSAAQNDSGVEASDAAVTDRRRFLDLCARFAVGLPPAVELLLMSAEAQATHNPPGCENGQGSPKHCTSLGQSG